MNSARDGPKKAKIGAGHLAGMGRQGLRELRAALYPDSNIAKESDWGIYGNATPGEVAQDRRPDDHELDLQNWERDGGSILKEREQKAKTSRDDQDRGKDDKDMDKET